MTKYVSSVTATSELYFNGMYDLIWKRIDKMNYDSNLNVKMQTANKPTTVSRKQYTTHFNNLSHRPDVGIKSSPSLFNSCQKVASPVCL